MGRDLAFLVPEMTLSMAVVFMMLAEMARLPRLVLVLGLGGLAAATLLTLPVLTAETTVFGGTYRIDMLSGWAKLILLPGTAVALLMARAELVGKEREGSVYALICLVTLGALMLSGSGDMMLLVLGVVLTGLGSFALVAFPGDDDATEAGMKYLVYGAVTGSVMIYGITFWFGGSGSTLFSELGALNGNTLVTIAGLIAVIVGLGYKAALVPFHFWAPDAYDGAPVSVAAYLSVITKIAAIFAFAQVLRDLPVNSGWPLVIALISAVTMTYGYLAALVQTNLVRLLAYSSVAQSGYFMLGIAALGRSDQDLPGIIVFGAAYVAMNLGAFAIVMVAGRDLKDLRGFGRRRPVAGVAMVLFLLSLTGIPPLFGFIGKVYLFAAAIEAGFLWLVVIGVLGSVLALGVYLRMIIPMYQAAEEVAAEDALVRENLHPALRLAWGVSAVVTLGMGLFAGLLPG
ncbi:NADH-quinone oxidoreductase subunit N [Candidatus Halocynthiibacter alkanivorans]|uniref:NADH-quinone oxidoreductase subunit N n=1 Tax=Candidatus Halocynthiibacter alkanivorans TaxID=2267619 RepID=UPI000DF32E0B|nr:NADH-quinone oxidoreductase subunit N [Candidatus Halocynthiibacter alkanivorans]